jgi:3-hydroxy-9,10-secoandrosta-1,3,5(10)-triene-9,17-dione monooxygenase reductase component
MPSLESLVVSAADFRRVLGHLPTGVTVVTALSNGGPVGMTANSVTSVSLDPPLILFCPARSSTTWARMRRAEALCVNVIAKDSAAIARQFSRKGADRFAGVPWHRRDAGVGLNEAAAWIECAMCDEHDAGDHTIVVAEVLAIDANAAAEPLVFCRGRYGTFAGAASTF